MKLALILIAIVFLPTIAQSQSTYYAPDDFGSIQDAIDDCADGDTKDRAFLAGQTS